MQRCRLFCFWNQKTTSLELPLFSLSMFCVGIS